ncbi:class I SAM-dependent methyltransferase [Nocardiopsis potens]|nr:class I SAM-dependent methyltransferase [Nocardiopsis potens]
MAQPTVLDFDAFYSDRLDRRGGPAAPDVPWDLRCPQPALVRAGQAVRSPVLEVGCGLGDNAVHLALAGHRVTAADISPAAVREARRRAGAAGAEVEFAVADATDLGPAFTGFATVVDVALLHSLPGGLHRAYARCLHGAARPGARLLLLCLAGAGEGPDSARPGAGPRPLSRERVEAALHGYWRVRRFRREELAAPGGASADPAWLVEAVRC